MDLEEGRRFVEQLRLAAAGLSRSRSKRPLKARLAFRLEPAHVLRWERRRESTGL
jgi:hypothetical protein